VSGAAAMAAPRILTPEWRAPRSVRAAFTLRDGGVSAAPFDSLNLGARVGDSPAAVAENRRRVREGLNLPAEPAWLEQVHGTRVADLDAPEEHGGAGADAVVTRRAGRVCAVQVADCLPVLFAARDGSAVGVAHAGWRGLAAGVLEATVAALAAAPEELIAWLGPAISARHFEVGSEVRQAFLERDPGASGAFTPNDRGRWQCDLGALAQRRLAALGVAEVSGGGCCTYADPVRFFSFRRDGRCGRMAALIWLE
jgi:YfiH family protein